MRYEVLRNTVIDGRPYSPGDLLDKNTRASAIEPALRTRRIAPLAERPKREPAPPAAKAAAPAQEEASDAAPDEPPAEEATSAAPSDNSAAIDTLGVDERVASCLVAAGVDTVGKAIDYLAEKGTFGDIAGIGRSTDKALQELLTAL